VTLISLLRRRRVIRLPRRRRVKSPKQRKRNPSQLDPLKADSVDLAAEWYFGDHSVAAVSFFYKDLKSFIASPRANEPRFNF
jgi:hypothetical protein